MAEIGSIPACAGEPRAFDVPCSGAEVYPRVCGGTYHRPVARRPIWGLSPRVRGNLLSAARLPIISRSIPACAGEPLEDTISSRRVYA